METRILAVKKRLRALELTEPVQKYRRLQCRLKNLVHMNNAYVVLTRYHEPEKDVLQVEKRPDSEADDRSIGNTEVSKVSKVLEVPATADGGTDANIRNKVGDDIAIQPGDSNEVKFGEMRPSETASACLICDQSFEEQQVMSEHVRAKHYLCVLCDEIFAERDDLKCHLPSCVIKESQFIGYEADSTNAECDNETAKNGIEFLLCLEPEESPCSIRGQGIESCFDENIQLIDYEPESMEVETAFNGLQTFQDETPNDGLQTFLEEQEREAVEDSPGSLGFQEVELCIDEDIEFMDDKPDLQMVQKQKRRTALEQIISLMGSQSLEIDVISSSRDLEITRYKLPVARESTNGNIGVLKTNRIAGTPIRTGQSPVMCSICYCPFSTRFNLYKHMKTHTQSAKQATPTYDVDSVCSICNKQVSSRNRPFHTRMHTGDVLFPCSLCDRKFCRQSDLTRHKRRHDKMEVRHTTPVGENLDNFAPMYMSESGIHTIVLE